VIEAIIAVDRAGQAATRRSRKAPVRRHWLHIGESARETRYAAAG